MESLDYKKRKYLSAIESAKYLNISVRMLHNFVKMQTIIKINAPKVRLCNQIHTNKRNSSFIQPLGEILTKERGNKNEKHVFNPLEYELGNSVRR